MAATGLNEFYEARRKEIRYMERAAVASSTSRVCPSCNISGCCSTCPRYQAYTYGTPYVNAYRQGGVKACLGGRGQTLPTVGGATPHRGFSCEVHKRSERIHEYDRLVAQTEKPGARYLSGVLGNRFNNNDYVSQH